MISDVITMIVAMGVILFVIISWITIHLGRNPRKGGNPPRDNNDVNIMNFVSMASLFVKRVWLINDTLDNLIVDSTVNTSVE